jgi:hypothetical protein
MAAGRQRLGYPALRRSLHPRTIRTHAEHPRKRGVVADPDPSWPAHDVVARRAPWLGMAPGGDVDAPVERPPCHDARAAGPHAARGLRLEIEELVMGGPVRAVGLHGVRDDSAELNRRARQPRAPGRLHGGSGHHRDGTMVARDVRHA